MMLDWMTTIVSVDVLYYIHDLHIRHIYVGGPESYELISNGSRLGIRLSDFTYVCTVHISHLYHVPSSSPLAVACAKSMWSLRTMRVYRWRRFASCRNPPMCHPIGAWSSWNKSHRDWSVHIHQINGPWTLSNQHPIIWPLGKLYNRFPYTAQL